MKKNKDEKYLHQLFCLFFCLVVRAFRGQYFSFLFSACTFSLAPMGQIQHDDNGRFVSSHTGLNRCR